MIVVPLDQAEELFTGDGPEAAGLLALIRDMALGADGEDGLPLIVAATIRTDRYELMQTAPELADLQTEQFDLTRDGHYPVQERYYRPGPAIDRRWADAAVSTSNWCAACWPTPPAAPTPCRCYR